MVSLGAGIYSPSSRSRGVDARSILTRGRPHLFRSKPRTLSPPGEVAAFKSERWPLSNRNRGRLQVGTVAAFKSEQGGRLPSESASMRQQTVTLRRRSNNYLAFGATT